ncbi:MAG: tRNA-binding protein [Thermoplasmatota archaeon]
MLPPIDFADFQAVEMRVGRIVEVEESTARKPSWKLRIDFGPHGVKTSSAAVRPWYSREDLVGRLVVCVVNFPPRQVGPVRSEVLTMGAVNADGRVSLLSPHPADAVELGSRIG